jgi:GAF domain-containing protein
MPVGSGHETAVPLSVVRYVQRAGEPLVVADATDDDRFARDPYLADAGCCSLLAVPILSRGTLRAVLLLENRLLRGAFTGERLDAVTLVAGQLAVSLDNAKLCAELTASRARIVAAGDTARPPYRTRPARRRPAAAGLPRPAPPHQRAHGNAHWGRRAGRAAARGRR